MIRQRLGSLTLSGAQAFSRRQEFLHLCSYTRPLTGGEGRRCGAPEGTFFSAPSEARDSNSSVLHTSLPGRFPFRCYLLIPKPHHSITLFAQISRSQSVLTLHLPLSMLTAVEFDNQSLRDAAEIGEVRTDAVLLAEFEFPEALGSEVLAQLPLLIVRPGTKPSAAIARSFVPGIHNRAP